MNRYFQLDSDNSDTNIIRVNTDSIQNNHPNSSTFKIIFTQLTVLCMMLMLAINYIGVSYYIKNGNSGFNFGLLRALFSIIILPFLYINVDEIHQDLNSSFTYKIFGSRVSSSNFWPILIVIITGTIRQISIPLSLMITSVTNVGIIQPIVPIAATIFAVIFKTEKFTIFVFISLLLCILGLLISERVWYNFKFDSSIILLLIIPIAKGIQISSLQLIYGISPVEIHRLQIIGLTVIVVPLFSFIEFFFISNGQWDKFVSNFTNLNAFDYLIVVYSVIAVIFFSWRIQIYAVKIIGSITVGLYQCFQPIFVFILAYFILNEQLESYKLIGSILICIGLIINQIGKFLQSQNLNTQNSMSPSSQILLHYS